MCVTTIYSSACTAHSQLVYHVASQHPPNPLSTYHLVFEGVVLKLFSVSVSTKSVLKCPSMALYYLYILRTLLQSARAPLFVYTLTRTLVPRTRGLRVQSSARAFHISISVCV